MPPFFSVVIPTYNRADKIEKTINSVIGQTFSDFEVLVMDDGSTDNTFKIIRDINDPRIKYRWQQNSGGPARPRNNGIDLASGKWIAFLDADDVWYYDKLEKIHASLIHNSSEVIGISHNIFKIEYRTQKKSLLKLGPFEKDFYKELLINGNRFSTSAFVVNRNFLEMNNLRFNESSNYVIVEDYDLWLRIALKGYEIKFIDDVLSEYIVYEDSLTKKKKQFYKNIKTLYSDHVFKIQNFTKNRQELFDEIITPIIFSEAKDFFITGQIIQAAKLLLSILYKSPKLSLRFLIKKYFYESKNSRIYSNFRD